MSRDARLPIFTVPFALGALFHEAHFSQALEGPPGLLVAAAAALLLLDPGSTPRLGVLCGLIVFEAAHDAPWIANHQLLCAAAALALLATMLGGAARRRGPPLDAARAPSAPGAAPLLTLSDVRSTLGLALPVVYAWACFHKLNVDFLAPETSSAAWLSDRLLSRCGLLPHVPPGALHGLAIHGAIAIEGILAILLLVPATRPLGIATALGFHLLLAIVGVEDFSAVAMAFLALYLPDSLVDRALARARAVLERTPLARPAFVRALEAACLLGASTVLLTGPWRTVGRAPLLFEPWLRGPTIVSRASAVLFLPYALAATALLALARRDPGPGGAGTVTPRGPAGVVLSICLLANGASPYLGWKTSVSFNMFSNLCVGGGATNHLLVPRSLAREGRSADLVRVIGSSDPALAALACSGRWLTWFELRRYAADMTARGEGDFSIAVERGGTVRVVARASADPELTRPVPWLVRKLVAFDPVPDRHVRRRHPKSGPGQTMRKP